MHSSVSRINAVLKRLISKEDTQTNISRMRLSTSSVSLEEHIPHSTSDYERHLATNKYSGAAHLSWLTDVGAEVDSKSMLLPPEPLRSQSSTAKSLTYADEGADEREKDDFDLLREERERQRQERQRQRIMQNVYTATSATAELLPALIASGLNLAAPPTIQISTQMLQPKSSDHRSATPSAKSSSSSGAGSKAAVNATAEKKQKTDEADKQEK